jgi:micrococcal nuclease
MRLDRSSAIPTLTLGAVLCLLAPHAAAAGAADRTARVARVLDGDSIVLADGTQVRYLGINAPEAGEPLSDAARALNRTLVEGREVRVVPGPKPRDGYGRTLALVHAGDLLVNAELLRAGLAHVMIFEPLAEEDLFARAERDARSARRGIWSAAAPAPLRITAPRRRPGRGRRPSLRVVTLCNVAGRPIGLDGFVLHVASARFGIPPSTLAPGHVALVVLARGRDRRTGPGPLRFHWPLAPPPADGAVVIRLRDPAGKEIDRVELPPVSPGDGRRSGGD